MTCSVNDFSKATRCLPPVAVEETAWDILLALYSDERRNLPLDKLAGLVSVSPPVLFQWLMVLEKRQIIVADRHGNSQEFQAVLTPAGRELLDRYLSATTDLQVGAHH